MRFDASAKQQRSHQHAKVKQHSVAVATQPSQNSQQILSAAKILSWQQRRSLNSAKHDKCPIGQHTLWPFDTPKAHNMTGTYTNANKGRIMCPQAQAPASNQEGLGPTGPIA
jgi:hypothetical protein